MVGVGVLLGVNVTVDVALGVMNACVCEAAAFAVRAMRRFSAFESNVGTGVAAGANEGIQASARVATVKNRIAFLEMRHIIVFFCSKVFLFYFDFHGHRAEENLSSTQPPH